MISNRNPRLNMNVESVVHKDINMFLFWCDLVLRLYLKKMHLNLI